MADVKGKFIQLAGSLMLLYDQALKDAEDVVQKGTGKTLRTLDPEGWYSTKVFGQLMNAYAKASSAGDTAIVTLGRMVYPTIKKGGGIPCTVATPLELLQFEAEGFLANHRGADVKPRHVLVAKEGTYVVSAPAPGYSQKLFEGVFLGILELTGVRTGKVAVTRGAPEFEYTVTW